MTKPEVAVLVHRLKDKYKSPTIDQDLLTLLHFAGDLAQSDPVAHCIEWPDGTFGGLDYRPIQSVLKQGKAVDLYLVFD